MGICIVRVCSRWCVGGVNQLRLKLELDGKWIKFKLRISPSKAQKGYFNLVFFKNDVELGYQNMIWTAKCGKPHIKFGIYRPGSTDISLQTSIIDYDYIKIKEIKN